MRGDKKKKERRGGYERMMRRAVATRRDGEGNERRGQIKLDSFRLYSCLNEN